MGGLATGGCDAMLRALSASHPDRDRAQMLDIAFVKPALPRGGALVAADGGGGRRSAASPRISTPRPAARVKRALAAAEFKGRKGQSCTVWAPLPDGQPGPSRIVAVGLGKAAEFSAEAVEAAGGAALPPVRSEREATVAADAMPPELAASFAMGMVLRGYRFGRYRTQEKEEDKPKLERVSVATGSVADAKAAWAPMRAVAEGVFLARDLVSEPANVLNPETMAERCRGLEKLGVVRSRSSGRRRCGSSAWARCSASRRAATTSRAWW